MTLGLGITSIGNGRNPALPFAGANIIAGAGIGYFRRLSSSQIDFASFIGKFLDPAAGALPPGICRIWVTLLGLGTALIPPKSGPLSEGLSPERQDQLALQVYTTWCSAMRAGITTTQ